MEKEIIKLTDVSLFYDKQKKGRCVLKDINMDIYPQEFVCVLGPSGCGKSSLLNLIAGFIKPSEGEILFKGKIIEGVSQQRGVVFQESNLYEWMNVRKNIDFGLRMRKLPKKEIENKTESILQKVDLVDSAKKYVYELSGGMKQRVGIARVLVNDPEILLMDEPFSSLDALNREKMQEFIRQIWRESQKTVLFVTHDVDEALMLGTRIIVIGGIPGKILFNESVEYYREFLVENGDDVRFSKDYGETRKKLLSYIGIN